MPVFVCLPCTTDYSSASVCLFALYYRLSASVCLFAMYYRLSSSVCLFEFTVQKVLYQHVLPTLLEECKQCDSVIYALPTLLTVIDFATRDDYCDNILTEFCAILTMPKPVQVTNSQLGYCLVEAYMVGGWGGGGGGAYVPCIYSHAR